jgi:putative toxin-antitoxin system antitoxin component (TIGR02293 family)
MELWEIAGGLTDQRHAGKEYFPPNADLRSGNLPNILWADCHKVAKIAKAPHMTFTPAPVIESVYRKLGGHAALGERVNSEADLARLVLHRIPLRVLSHVERGGFSKGDIERYIIPARTQRHRRQKRERLSVEESDRVVRLMRIQALAEDVFGDAGKAGRWLRETLGILGGHAPLELAQTESGARVVEDLLAKIDWGAAA